MGCSGSQARGKHVRVLTIGTFDLFHIGHVNLLREAARHGDELYVGINSDRFVEQYKRQPTVIGEKGRLAVVRACRYVTHAEINDGPGRDLIERLAPQIIAIDTGWHRADYLKQIDISEDWLEKHRVGLLYLPRTLGVSTTQIRGRLAA